ncbi:aldehyde oxidoreductase molybdenum-binding subunit PaoC [Xanthomonas euroxanthea]|uniref:Xanthine dehydrogenase family protein molybdopterin-binding subunit n=1 Tax=Xanthomonas euroxanthea TaxID=2259622 RepID=A0AA46C8E7_9XANT|nr:aldehyde oxidoreductase molybdenum-binding subunit PaoC [Xanthomonas euroxanthea]CAE1136346.1 xanthine dehydrogenase family protein molybdopterin-binding subunit [Xanthomonas euroxanthea]SUZ28380.1 xanthine dehydrogenase family protein molybdopterin-binding subunit [Xanthomonas euroxanthea]
MKFETPAGNNPIDRMRIVGQPHDRIDGPAKTCGAAPYAAERHDVAPHQAHGYVLGAKIAKGTIRSIDASQARKAAGVIAIVTAESAGPLSKGNFIDAAPLGGPEVQHYHQAVAVVVAETFEQARAASHLIRVDYARMAGTFDLELAGHSATRPEQMQDGAVGDFYAAFAAAPVTVDGRYSTPDQSHMMMEPHATIADWSDGKLSIWTSVQTIDWARRDIAATLGIPKASVHVSSPYIGGGFGGKATSMSDAILAALASKAAGRPVKVVLTRELMVNNTVHRPATIQRLRIGADRTGRILAIGHETLNGNLPGGFVEPATIQTPSLYAGANRMTATRLAQLDLPEGSSMRAPGEAPGMMALEAAMDELAVKLGMDPVELRIRNDTQVDPSNPDRPFSSRKLVECLKRGAERFGWAKRQAQPGRMRDGEWMVGMGVASAIRGARTRNSGARARLDASGTVTIETDMTDIGTGSYTILAQTAAETMGVTLEKIVVRLGDSDFPVTVGSVGQRGAASTSSAVFAACMKLREAVTQRLGFQDSTADFSDGHVSSAGLRVPLQSAARDGELVVEDTIEFGTELPKKLVQETFGAHFVEVGVHAVTGEIRVRRMLAVCAAGRILNPKTARSQVIGAMTMGVGAALTEELVVDKRLGFFVNHDLASYEVPVHADIPHQEVIFLDEVDATVSPTKVKGVGELGLSGVAAAVANAVYNATGIRVRDYPITLEKILPGLPAIA